MTSTDTTKAGRGRPAIGKEIKTRLPEKARAKFDAFVKDMGVKEADAARMLLIMALGNLGDVGPMTLGRLFPELSENDVWERLDAGDFDENRGSFGNAETVEGGGYDVTLSVGAKLVRGWWLIYCHKYSIITKPDGRRGIDTEEKNIDRSRYILVQGKDVAIDAYKQFIQDLTAEFFDPARGEMWCEGFDDEYIGYDIPGYTRIPWRSLIPAASVVGGVPEEEGDDDGVFRP